MKNNYNSTISLQCATCNGKDFDFNDNKSYVKCLTCNREYLGGYDELVRFNNNLVNREVKKKADEIANDFANDIMKAFKGK